MDFESFIVRAEEHCRKCMNTGGHYRRGQAYFNVLHDCLPSLAERIRGTGLDPFYDDNRLGRFLNWLEGELAGE